MEAPATSAEYRGIACPRAIFVPTTPRLLIAFPASRIRRDCRHWSSAGLNAELSTKPMSESSRIAPCRRVFLRWFAAKPMEPRLLMA
jgi:hypothetical protein